MFFPFYLGGNWSWYQLGANIVHMFLYELTSSFPFNLPYFIKASYFITSGCNFTQMLSFRQFSRLQPSTFSCGACGQTLDPVLIKACPCKLLLPQNARVNPSLAITHFTSSKGKLGCSYCFIYRPQILLVSAKIPLLSSLPFFILM